MTDDPVTSGAVTQWLLDWGRNDKQALDQMLPVVYEELHRLAAHYLSREGTGHTLQPTALVHEAYLRLIDQRRVDWRNRAQFLGVAASMMRRILVNHARDRSAQKRGGRREQVTLSLVESPAGRRADRAGRRAAATGGARPAQGARGRAQVLRRPHDRGDRRAAAGVRRHGGARVGLRSGLAVRCDRRRGGRLVTAGRWERIETLFHAAVGLGPSERRAMLAREAEDPALVAEVERLLAAHDRAGNFIQTPAIALTAVPVNAEELAAEGRRIGAYRIVREIGRGGMGAVYLAERADEVFRQQVAIKLIKRGMDTDLVLSRFRAERQILASLDHPNIARLLDGGTTEDGLPYFAMEYIEGQPIDAFADEHRLSIAERLGLFLQVCAAVSYAHQHLIVHRDIKPVNILVTADGAPKLLDFGIAKVLQADDDVTATATGLRMLTPEYASPEQVEGQHATTVSDVYSLGVVLYELLTGRSPYRTRSRSPLEIAEAVCTTEPVRPSAAVV